MSRNSSKITVGWERKIFLNFIYPNYHLFWMASDHLLLSIYLLIFLHFFASVSLFFRHEILNDQRKLQKKKKKGSSSWTCTPSNASYSIFFLIEQHHIKQPKVRGDRKHIIFVSLNNGFASLLEPLLYMPLEVPVHVVNMQTTPSWRVGCFARFLRTVQCPRWGLFIL